MSINLLFWKMMNEKLLTVTQAAKMKGVTRAAVYKAIAEGRVPHQIVLGRSALLEADVVAWVPRTREKGIPRSKEIKARISAGQKHRWKQRRENEGGMS